MGSGISKDEANYTLTVKTGNSKGAGTDGKVHIVMSGTKEIESEAVADGKGSKLERKDEDIFYHKGEDVGDIIFITVELKPRTSTDNTWQVDYITIENHYSKKSFNFPVYKWLKPGQFKIQVREAKAIPATKSALDGVHSLDRKNREELLSLKRRQYRWDERISKTLTTCWVCDVQLGDTVLTCNKCKLPKYCGKEHQEEDSSNHAYTCRGDKKADPLLDGLPFGFILAKDFEENSLPIEEHLSVEKFSDRANARFTAKLRALSEKIETVITKEKFDSVSDYDKLYSTKVRKPDRGHLWKDDVEFGYLRVCGVNPLVLERLTVLPEKFPVTNEMVKSFIGESTTLEQELKSGSIYWIDYPLLQNLEFIYPTKIAEGKLEQTLSPMALFQVRNGHLRPLAIQLFQTPHAENNPIYLPSDGIAWQVAKIYVNSADALYHQCSSHLGRAHFVEEGVIIAAHRHLSESHPIFKLLKPHWRDTLAINQSGVKLLLDVGGVFDKVTNIKREGAAKLLADMAKTWKLIDNNPVYDLKKRGVDDAKLLPFYPYRDDILQLYQITFDYVSKVINYFYNDEKNPIHNDIELQNFLSEIRKYGYKDIVDPLPWKDDSKVTREDIIQFFSIIIHTAGPHHAAVNNPQFNHYGFPPYTTFGSRIPPPNSFPSSHKVEKKLITENDLVQALPNFEMAMASVAVGYVLSKDPPGVERLGEYREKLFEEEDILKFQLEAREALTKLSKKIDEREEQSKQDSLFAYPYLSPKYVSPSVTS